jgi:putative membrane protein insertion efficiency factor
MSPLLPTLPQRALMLAVRGYQLLVSPLTRPSCRYEPSCSAYALGALQQHGAAAGSYLAARRILRCHPFCDGGHDPVPQHAPALFRRLVRASPGVADAPSATSITISIDSSSS